VLAHRLKALTHTLFFVLGFSIVFLALGFRNYHSYGTVPKWVVNPRWRRSGNTAKREWAMVVYRLLRIHGVEEENICPNEAF